MARFAIEKPFLGRSFAPNGYYWQSTEEGYIPYDILGTGLQMSPIRGTLVGRLRRAYRRDYPVQHTGLVGKSEVLKQMAERLGFYAGPWQTWTGNVLARMASGEGSGSGLTANLGEDLPAPLQTLLMGTALGFDAITRLVGPDNTALVDAYVGTPGQTVRKLVKEFFPNRFMDYYENIYMVSTFGLTREQIEADPDKTWMLDEAFRQVAWRQVISEQSSLVRYRPEEFTKMRTQIDQAIADVSGVPLGTIEELREQGKQVGDVIPLSRVELSEVRNLEAFALVGSVYAPLGEGALERIKKAQREYYDRLDHERDLARDEQTKDDNDLNAGLITGRQWRDAYRDRWAGLHKVTEALQRDPQFAGVPFTSEERAAFNDKYNISTALKSDIDLVMDEYYRIEPVEDPDTGDIDWNQFFRSRKSVLDWLPEDIRPQVNDYLHQKESPVMREFREGRDYMATYWDLETYLPIWFESIGLHTWASKYKTWARQRTIAEREATLAAQRGVHPDVVARMRNRPEFTMVRRWEQEYRAILRDPRTTHRIPGADPRIPEYLRKFFSS